MYKIISGIAIITLISSCGGSEESHENDQNEEMEDTVSNYEVNPEDLREDGPNEFNWIENVLTYEGKDPDSHISLALMISGVRDTLDLFTIWSFPEQLSDETKALYGFPENTVASIEAYYLGDFISIQEISETRYDILYSTVYKDTVSTDSPIGEIIFKEGAINYSIDLPSEEEDQGFGSFYKFGETSPWDNFEE